MNNKHKILGSLMQSMKKVRISKNIIQGVESYVRLRYNTNIKILIIVTLGQIIFLQ